MKSGALSRLMRDFNGLMAGVCEAGEPRCQFVGDPLGAAWTNDDFVDEGHFSRRGGEKLATMLAARIRALDPAALAAPAR